MKPSYRTVVIRGGVVGSSVGYHLAKLGRNDPARIERTKVTSGATWHATAGLLDITVQIMGYMRPAKIITMSPCGACGPCGAKMRG
ncbi:MAG: hypothetical protein Q9M48_08705 [Rhodobacterales bacterium]|nr:hypothetical protein [Rhodobacterales bacterium]